MSAEWDDYADGWDSNPAVIAYAENAYRTLTTVVDLAGLRVLDFGCGTGLLTERMAPLARSVVGLDASGRMIAVLEGKKLPRVETVAGLLSDELIGQCQSLARPFDLIVASSVCAFLPAYEQTLSLLASLLVPGGTFVQWDWLATEGQADFGLDQERIITAHRNAGLLLQSIDQPFSLAGPDGEMPVLMAVAKAPDVVP